jgi:hypothetical protein
MHWNSLILIGAVSIVAACSDGRDPLAPSSKGPLAVPSDLTPRAMLDCVGTLAGRSGGSAVKCEPATVDGPAAAADPQVRQMIAQSVTLGRQNVDVTLAFSNFAFSGGVFSANVTVQNLLNQTMGDTVNGSLSLSGTRVFFISNPPVAVTSGSGTATIAAPDTGVFTATFQPYFDYSAAIAPGATSPAQVWKFNLSPGVKGFTFSVEISTILPAEKSIRRWTMLNQGLTSNNLTGIWRHTATDAYAVGVNGTVLQYNGSAWAAVSSGLSASNNYRGVSGVSGQAAASVWAVGDNGVAVHDTAGTWTSVSTGQSNTLYGVWVAGPSNVYAVGANATVVHYDGTQWTTMSTPGGTKDLHAIWGSDATHMWAVGDKGRLIFGNGTTWVKQSSGTNEDLTGVWGDAATDVYAVGTSGTIIHLPDSAGDWSSMPNGSSNDLAAIGGSAATDIWAVGNDGTTLHYDGTSWSTVGPNSGIPLTGVTAGSSSSIWAVGVQGSLLSSSGSAWQVSMQSGLSFYGVWASSATDVYVSSLGTVLHYDGTHWTNAYVSDADSMDGIWGGGPQPATVYSIGANGTLATLSGGIWTTQNIGTAAYALWGPNTTSFYTGAGEGLVGYFDNGAQSSYRLGTSGSIQSIWGSSSSNVYAAASDGAIWNETHANGTWNKMITPNGTGMLNSLWGSSSTDIYAVGANGTVLHNTGATAWTAQTSGTTVTLRGVWADTPGSGYTADAYAVGDNGTVQHYNGDKWINMPAPVSSRFRSVYGTSATNLYVVGDNGVVLLGTQ